MPLSPDQLNKVNQWMASKGIRKNCSCCGFTNWECGAVVVMQPQGWQSSTLAPSSIPVLPIGCSRCGHIMFFSAKMIGL